MYLRLTIVIYYVVDGYTEIDDFLAACCCVIRV